MSVRSDSVCAVVRQLLIDLSLGTASGSWPIYYNREPDTPDDCVTVYDTRGIGDGREMVAGEVIERFGIQVRVRAMSESVGSQKVRDIEYGLDRSVSVTSVTVGEASYTVQSVDRTPTNPLGAELGVSRRRLWTINATVTLWQNP